jgi:hypothetical protein
LRTKQRLEWNVAFLMKDIVPLAVSIYVLKQDVARIRNQELP